MTYLCWGVIYEGGSDQAYYDVLLQRLMEELIVQKGTRSVTVPTAPAMRINRGSVEVVAQNICDGREAYHLVFIHADTGGRALETAGVQQGAAYREALQRICAWPPERCIIVAPRHETEAWVLADPQAVADTLGYRGSLTDVGLPQDAKCAERLVDPKLVLNTAVAAIRKRRKPFSAEQLFPAIALRQDFDCLRRSQSFRDCEDQLTAALVNLGCIAL